MGFALAALGLSLLAAAVLIRALAGARAAEAPAAAYDLQIWRGQLDEVARDQERGTLAPADAERARTEIARRILEADRAIGRAGAGRDADAARGSRGAAAAAVLVVALIAGGIGLYTRIGAPGYRDLPVAERLARADEARRTRPSQAEAEARMPKTERPAPDPQQAALMERLRKAVAARPDDLQGHELLARSEAQMGNFAASAAAQQVVLRLKDGDAGARDFLALADAQILAAGGYVSPEAEQALTETLKRDPQDPTARFYTGLMFAQTLRPDLAFRLWQALEAEGHADAPWMPLVRDQIAAVAAAAGIDYRPPAAAQAPAPAPGPDAAAIAEAGQMPAAERDAMIRQMVERLDQRLAAEGGSAADWARLITALGVLGEADRARAALATARTRLAADPAGLAAVDAAAAQAGLAP